MNNEVWTPEEIILYETQEELHMGANDLDSALEELEPYVFTDKLTYSKKRFESSGSGKTLVIAHGPEESMKFAVKEFKMWQDMDDGEKKARIEEIKHMINLKHKNIVRCFGFMREPIKVVYEYCDEGSYVDYCNRKREEGKVLKHKARVKILMQACRGLIYLVTQRIIHRDIAARNILLDKHLTAKISHFDRIHQLKEGEDVFMCREVLKEPFIRWSAPETLLQGWSSEASDVWAFGVTMWEVLTNQEPYGEYEQADVRDAILLDNLRLDASEIPDLYKDERKESLRNLVRRCWDDRTKRPTMKDIGDSLAEIYKQLAEAANSEAVNCLDSHSSSENDSYQSSVLNSKAKEEGMVYTPQR